MRKGWQRPCINSLSILELRCNMRCKKVSQEPCKTINTEAVSKEIDSNFKAEIIQEMRGR